MSWTDAFYTSDLPESPYGHRVLVEDVGVFTGLTTNDQFKYYENSETKESFFVFPKLGEPWLWYRHTNLEGEKGIGVFRMDKENEDHMLFYTQEDEDSFVAEQKRRS